MTKTYDKYIGQTFNELTIIKFIERRNNRDKYLCKCSCGEETTPEIRHVIRNETKSCGCKRKHGLRYHPLYGKWKRMRQRCRDSKCKEYKHYGGKGIKVCEKWLNSPESFINWAIKNGWKKDSKLEIDRIDSNKNYCPENCRLVTHKQNIQNKKPGITGHKYVYINGKKFTVHKKINDQVECFGTFDTVEQAVEFCINNGLYDELENGSGR